MAVASGASVGPRTIIITTITGLITLLYPKTASRLSHVADVATYLPGLQPLRLLDRQPLGLVLRPTRL